MKTTFDKKKPKFQHFNLNLFVFLNINKQQYNRYNSLFKKSADYWNKIIIVAYKHIN